jgi:hypothetical protein
MAPSSGSRFKKPGSGPSAAPHPRFVDLRLGLQELGGEGSRQCGLRWGFTEHPAPPTNIPPCTKLESGLRVHTHARKAARFVQAHAGGVRQSNSAEDSVKPLPAQDGEKLTIQGASDALTMTSTCYVDGGIRRPAISASIRMGPGIGIALDGASGNIDEPWIGRRESGHPRANLLRGGRRRFEGNRSLGDVRRVYLSNRGRIIRSRGADRRAVYEAHRPSLDN